jgi:hypothetical protein
MINTCQIKHTAGKAKEFHKQGKRGINSQIL